MIFFEEKLLLHIDFNAIIIIWELIKFGMKYSFVSILKYVQEKLERMTNYYDWKEVEEEEKKKEDDVTNA